MMWVTNKELKNFGKEFLKELTELEPEGTIVTEVDIATTDFAKLLYGEPSHYWLLNNYNKRIPTAHFKKGEEVSYPNLEDVEVLIREWKDRGVRVAQTEKDTLPLS